MDSMRKIAITDGPLKGKTVEVHVNETRFTTHAGDGHYVVAEGGAKWHGRRTTTEKPKPASKTRAPKPAKPAEAPAPGDAPTESLTV